VVVEPTTSKEIRSLLAVLDRELRDADSAASTDGRFINAFWACLTIARIALRANGLRPRSVAHHYLVIESLEHTLGLDLERVRRLQAYRAKRARAEYEMAGVVSDVEYREARHFAQELKQELLSWLKSEHPELLSP
jgi:ribosomal protein S13